jgi:hypothetical protein
LRTFIVSAFLAGAALFVQPAQAKKDPAPSLASCGIGDISPVSSLATKFDASTFSCAGYVSGNVLNNSNKGVAAQISALSALGLTFASSGADAFNFDNFEKIDLNGLQVLDFKTLLNGVTYIGIHFGNGAGGPGNGTAFYKFDVGTDRDKLYLLYGASSDVVLYKTGPRATLPTTSTPAVPEPATWVMMIAGIGAVGLMYRRRRKTQVNFA